MSATTKKQINRRRFERFALVPMYTGVRVRRLTELRIDDLDGHVYDVSEQGARIELDEPLIEGDRVAVELTLPGENRDVRVAARVVRVNDEQDDPGPRRIAIEFKAFQSDADRERLIRFLGSGRGSRIAG